MQKILKFKPIYKEKIWGGSKLKTKLNRPVSSDRIGESWEISDYGNDLSIIENGIFAGKTLREAYTSHRKDILGEVFGQEESFPLLIKIIDAKEKLSVQVHPDDKYASEKDPESSGKKEAWLILESDPGADIVCGFSKDVQKEEYRNLILQNNAEEVLQKIRIKSGDAFLLNPGTIHAIGAGALILEIQQSSDSTYRVYDYGRPGDDGKPRQLHLEKALDVINFHKSGNEEKLIPKNLEWKFGERKLLTGNDKFRLEVLNFGEHCIVPSMYVEDVFQVINILDGECSFPAENISFRKGDSFLITAFGMKEKIELKTSFGARFALMGIGSDWINFRN
ncbi:MAG: class I mannose-6-phosphate isomerase [Leptospira sp.]|nr:class I mannose-6-phosphate isomerase [Leptospira sp.]